MPYNYGRLMLPQEKVFRDPIHNYIHVNHQVILDLISTKEFQRLRRIKQLGTTSFTFHGGEHSRFSHSLGVYEITRRICNHFERHYQKTPTFSEGWDDSYRLVVLCAALLHDVGHGPYSHTFEGIFNTDHEAITTAIITSPDTEIHQILKRVSDTFPDEVASVIMKTHTNPQVVQMISSQIDADRMDYLLRDAYYTGTEYGTFDLTRIFRVIRPYRDGIAYQMSGMHAVEDYIVGRYQMYMQVYFHPVSRGMEVILHHLLRRGQQLFQENSDYFIKHSPLLVPFLKEDYQLSDYLKLDDGVLNTYFVLWNEYDDPILSDLADRFLTRKPLKSVVFNQETEHLIPHLKELVAQTGFDADAYTAINSSYDLPYDFYRPDQENHRTQIELIEEDGTLIELAKASDLVAALAGQSRGDQRFYFPKEMLYQKTSPDVSLFDPDIQHFTSYIKNSALRIPEKKGEHYDH